MADGYGQRGGCGGDHDGPTVGHASSGVSRWRTQCRQLGELVAICDECGGDIRCVTMWYCHPWIRRHDDIILNLFGNVVVFLLFLGSQERGDQRESDFLVLFFSGGARPGEWMDELIPRH